MEEPKSLRIKPSIAVCFILAWLFGAALHFFYYDTRFHLLYFLLRSSANFILLFAILVCAFSLGEKTLRCLKIHFDSCLETFVFSTALGFGIISCMIFALGISHLLYKTVAYLLLTALFAFSVPRTIRFLKRLRVETENQDKENSPFITTVKIIFIISTCLYLIQVFTPPVNYDSLAYHLAVPKIYAGEHRILYIPHNVYANFPMTMEFLYLFSLLLYGDTLAKLTHFSMGILTILAIYSFSKKQFDRKTAFTASLIFYNIPFVGLLSGWAFNDLMLTLYEFLAIIALLNWLLPFTRLLPHHQPEAGDRSQQQSWLIVSAIFCGLSISTKYPALLFLLPFSLIAIAINPPLSPFTKGGRGIGALCPFTKVGRRIGLFFLISLLVASPWFIKNIVYTHNPVYPFFHNFFHKLSAHPGDETFDVQRFMKHHRPQDFSVGNTLSLLWKTGMDKKIGPAFILFLPLIILVRPIKPVIKLLLIYCGVYFLLWSFFTHQDTRFLIPVFPALSIASAYTIRKFTWKSKFLTIVTHLVILFVCLFNLSWMPLTIGKYDLLKVAVGIENRDEFLMNSPFYQYPAFYYINSELPEDAKILFIGENQTYYCNREFVSNSPFDTNIIVEIANNSSSEKDIRDKLKSLGITHILVNMSEVKRVTKHYQSFNWASESANRIFIDFLMSGNYLKELFFEGGVFVSEVVYE